MGHRWTNARTNATTADLLALIPMHFPTVDLSEHVTRWAQIDGGLYLVLGFGHTMFSRHGDDLHLAEPVTGGKVVCRVIRPDGTYSDTEAEDPYSAEQAKLN
jgi:hypothetical protein